MSAHRACSWLFVATMTACGGHVAGGADAGSRPGDPRGGGASGDGGIGASDSGSPGTTIAQAGGTELLAPFKGTVSSMAIDDQAIYLGLQDGTILREPKEGGQPLTLGPSGTATYPEGLAAAGEFIYYTSLSRGEVGRVPKRGGVPETLVRDQESPYQLAVDATHLYWVNYGGSGTGNTGQVVRRPLTGGPIEVLADKQQSPQAIALTNDYVYFTHGPSGDRNGAICRLAKAGGDVEFLVERIGDIFNLAIVGADVYYVDFDDHVLYRLAAGAGPVQMVPAVSVWGVTPLGGGALFGKSDGAFSEVRWVSADNPAGKLVLRWSRGGPAGYAPAVAMVADDVRVYWAEWLGVDSALLSAPRP